MKNSNEKMWRSVCLITVALLVICWFANSWIEKKKQCMVDDCSRPSCVSLYEGEVRLCAKHTGKHAIELKFILDRIENGDTGYWKETSRNVGPFTEEGGQPPLKFPFELLEVRNATWDNNGTLKAIRPLIRSAHYHDEYDPEQRGPTGKIVPGPRKK